MICNLNGTSPVISTSELQCQSVCHGYRQCRLTVLQSLLAICLFSPVYPPVCGVSIPRSFSKETISIWNIAMNSTQSSFASSWMRVVEKPSVWRRAIHALVQHERFFWRYISCNKPVIVNSNNLLRLLFFIVANDNAQWRDNDVKMNILCCWLSGLLVGRQCWSPKCQPTFLDLLISKSYSKTYRKIFRLFGRSRT